FCVGYQGFNGIFFSEITRQNMHAITHRGGDGLERTFACTRDSNGRTLGVQGSRNCPADCPACTSHEPGLAGQIEHHRFLPAFNAAKSSGLPTAGTVSLPASRLINPLSTFPPPTS